MATILSLGPRFGSLDDQESMTLVMAWRESRRTIKAARKAKSKGKAKAKKAAELSPKQLLALLTDEEREEIMKEFLE